MSEPGGVGTGGTEGAWEALYQSLSRAETVDSMLARIRRLRPIIEAEATRVERERVVRAVKGLEERNAYEEVLEGNSEVRRSEVLAIVSPKS